jgi:hypothetical protein
MRAIFSVAGCVAGAVAAGRAIEGVEGKHARDGYFGVRCADPVRYFFGGGGYLRRERLVGTAMVKEL